VTYVQACGGGGGLTQRRFAVTAALSKITDNTAALGPDAAAVTTLGLSATEIHTRTCEQNFTHDHTHTHTHARTRARMRSHAHHLVTPAQGYDTLACRSAALNACLLGNTLCPATVFGPEALADVSHLGGRTVAPMPRLAASCRCPATPSAVSRPFGAPHAPLPLNTPRPMSWILTATGTPTTICYQPEPGELQSICGPRVRRQREARGAHRHELYGRY
jgi:hypothetical protein